MSAHITYSEGSVSFTGRFVAGSPSVIVRFDPVSQQPYLVLDIPDDGAMREGVRLELDYDLGDATAKAMRRAITEYRKEAHDE